MSYLDYKISSIIRNGTTTKVFVRFYEGDYVKDENEKDVYKRSKVVNEETYEFNGDLSDEKIRELLNEKLDKHPAKVGKQVLEGQRHV